jgi:hypothetical protein
MSYPLQRESTSNHFFFLKKKHKMAKNSLVSQLNFDLIDLLFISIAERHVRASKYRICYVFVCKKKKKKHRSTHGGVFSFYPTYYTCINIIISSKK